MVLNNDFNTQDRKLITRMVFGLLFLNQVYLFYSKILFSQLHQPVLKKPGLDLTYWVMHILKIPEIVTSPIVSNILDIAMFLLPILCIAFPLKRLLSILYLLLFFIYFISFNTYSCHHAHTFIGIILIIIPFCIKNNLSFSLLWKGVRYYTLFIYFSAFLWKLTRGSGFNTHQLSEIIKLHQAPFLIFNPGSFLSYFYNFLLEIPNLLIIINIIALVLEASFIIGFFSKKFDHYLFVATLILHMGFIIFADAYVFQLLILSLTLLKFDYIRKGKIEANYIL